MFERERISGMLTSDIKLIASPVIVVLNGEETEYENGTAAEASFKPDNRFEVRSISMRDDKIIVQLAEWECSSSNWRNYSKKE